MNRRIVLGFVSACVFVVGGCSGGGGSGRGESCRARNDCAGGLHCINDICTLSDFSVATTTKSCDLIECSVDADCCTSPSSSFCDNLQMNCSAGDSFSCQQYESECACHRGCSADNRCVSTCTMDSDCAGGRCVSGSCVECMADSDCGGNRSCNMGTCVSGCTTNSECPYFNTCMSGTCVETGCTADHECIASTGNPRAVCVDSKCSAPCESDAECNVAGYRFQACQSGQCVYVGCQTDEECRIFLDVTPGSSSSAVCR